MGWYVIKISQSIKAQPVLLFDQTKYLEGESNQVFLKGINSVKCKEPLAGFEPGLLILFSMMVTIMYVLGMNW